MWARNIRARGNFPLRFSSPLLARGALPTNHYTASIHCRGVATKTTLVPFTELRGFLHKNLLNAVRAGFDTRRMLPVQREMLGKNPDWRRDCVIEAETGSGKTLAFLLPALHNFLKGEAATPPGKIATLIIAPTEELAQHVAATLDQLQSRLIPRLTPSLRYHLAVGGPDAKSNLHNFLGKPPPIVIATLRGLKGYLAHSEAAKMFSDMKTMILDDADVLVKEKGFFTNFKKTLKLLPPKKTGWQGMCVTSTRSSKVQENLAGLVLTPEHKTVSILGNDAAFQRVSQYHVIYPSMNDLLTTLASLLEHESEHFRIIVIAPNAGMVSLLYNVFSKSPGSKSILGIFPGLAPKKRKLESRRFNNRYWPQPRVLFTSNATRNVDLVNAGLLIQVGIPESDTQYVQRIGHAGRHGHSGRAVILLTEQESYFLQNPVLPIEPHPDTDRIIENADEHAREIKYNVKACPKMVKDMAYRDFIRWSRVNHKHKKMGLDRTGLVQVANDFAVHALFCDQPPPIAKELVRKLRLRYIGGVDARNRWRLAGGYQKSAPPQ